MKSVGYEPFRNGIETGNGKSACPVYGVKPRNQHSLRQAAECDWLKRPAAERVRLVNERSLRQAA